MKKDRLWRHLAIAFVLALVLYGVGFSWIEHRRTRLGPWQVTFVHEPPAQPLIEINQEHLGIRDVQICISDLPEMPSTNRTVSFEPGQQVPFDVPFGQCIFMDPTFLPGTVALKIGGHQIQLLPRTLIIDDREVPWKSGLHLDVPPPPGEETSTVPK